MSQASAYVEHYETQKRLVGRTRFQPKNARKETDPKLPHVRFFRFEDGSMIRVDPERNNTWTVGAIELID